MKFEGLLPIGSVVRLDLGEHRLMITGYAQRLEGKDEVCDYVACLWPEGHQAPDANYVFNRDKIVEVLFLGCQNDGQQALAEKLDAALADYRSKNSK